MVAIGLAHRNTRLNHTPSHILKACEGAVFAEYLVVLVFIGLFIGFAVGGCGILLLNLYRWTQAILVLPIP